MSDTRETTFPIFILVFWIINYPYKNGGLKLNALTPEFFYPRYIWVLTSQNQKVLFFTKHTFFLWTWQRKEKLQTTIGNLKRKLPK
jgi:hypothetical protein